MINKTIIIAEAGVNHNGDIVLAKKLIDAAANAGDATDNAFTMTWRCGTAEGTGTPMNTDKLIEQGLAPDRYVTNVLFNLIAL